MKQSFFLIFSIFLINSDRWNKYFIDGQSGITFFYMINLLTFMDSYETWTEAIFQDKINSDRDPDLICSVIT